VQQQQEPHHALHFAAIPSKSNSGGTHFFSSFTNFENATEPIEQLSISSSSFRDPAGGSSEKFGGGGGGSIGI